LCVHTIYFVSFISDLENKEQNNKKNIEKHRNKYRKQHTL